MCSFWARRLSYLIPCILIKPSIIYSFTMFLWYPDLARAPRPTARKKGSGYENERVYEIDTLPFSYPEPILRAVRREALAKSITGYHENMVINISGIRTITFVVNLVPRAFPFWEGGKRPWHRAVT